MQTWEVDPKTGDYVLVNGSPKETNSLKMAAYFRMRTRRDQWLYAPDNKYGSKFHQLARN